MLKSLKIKYLLWRLSNGYFHDYDRLVDKLFDMGPCIIDPLIKELEDNQDVYCSAVVEILGKMGNSRAVQLRTRLNTFE